MARATHEAESSHVLVIGVTSFTNGLDELPAEPVADLVRAIENNGHIVTHVASPAAQEIRELLDGLGGDEFDVVHVMSHAEVPDSGRLMVAGADAERPASPKNKWIAIDDVIRDLVDTSESGRGALLLLLDACHAGTAANVDVARARSSIYVIAATEPDELALDARLTRAVAAVLERISRKDSLGAADSIEIISLDLVVAAMADEISRLTEGGTGSPQTLVTSRHALNDQRRHPFFRNPGFRRAAVDPDRPGDPALADTVDPVLGERHFGSRAAGGDPSRNTRRCHFTGRLSELRTLARWLDDPEPAARLWVVTGSPGMGKSALLGVLVCLAHPELHAYADMVESRIHDRDAKPSLRRHGEIAAVHARNRPVAELVASICRQLGLPDSAEPDAVIEGLRGRHHPVIVLDALDEAADPAEVHHRLLVPLAEAEVCRLLVGTRRQARFAGLFDRAGAGQIDLDIFVPDRLRSDVADYVTDLLREYPTPWPRSVATEFADATAVTVVPLAPDEVEVGPLLLAQLHTHRIAHGPVPDTVQDARRLGETAPRSIEDAFRRELAADGSDPWLGPLLVAVAHARGVGMPVRLAQAVARRLAPHLPERSEQTMADLLRDRARFYLRTDIDSDGSAVYALFHQSLQEFLREYPDAAVHGSIGERTGPGIDASVYEALLDTLGYVNGIGADWDSRLVPYLRRHLGQHAIAAGRFDELAVDPEFLARADHAYLMRDLREATSPDAAAAAAVYRASFAYHSDARPERRLQRLALEAARQTPSWLRDIRAAIAGPLSTRWSTATSADTGLIDVVEGHTGTVESVACTVVDGNPVAITGSSDRTVRVWNLRTGDTYRELTGHTGPVWSVACAVVDGDPVGITGSSDRTVRVWDLRTGDTRKVLTGHTNWVRSVACTVLDGDPVAVAGDSSAVRVWDLRTGGTRKVLTGHTNWVRSVACTVLNGDSVAVTGSDDRTVRVWDLRAGDTRLVLTGHTTWVRSVACAVLDGDPVAIAGSDDGTVRMWDLRTGDTREVLTGHTGEVRSIACTVLNGDPVAVTGSDDRTARVWDLRTGDPRRIYTGHTGGVRSVACAVVDGDPVAIAGDSGAVRVWDLRTDIRRMLTGHTNRVRSIACTVLNGDPVAVTGSDDRTVRVWDLRTGRTHRILTGHTGEVRSVACTVLNGRPIAITGSDDRTARVWDLRTGDIRLVLTGHTGGVGSVACTVLNGRWVAVAGGDDSTVRVWDLRTGDTRLVLTGHTGRVGSVACTVLSGRPVAITGSSDGTVRIWDLRIGVELAAHDFPATVDTVACAPDTIVVGYRSDVAALDYPGMGRQA